MERSRFTLDEINLMDREEFVRRFGGLFERSPWAAEEAWKARPFATSRELFAELCRVVTEAPATAQLALIRSYPDLVGTAALTGTLTREPTAGHDGAGLDRLSTDEIDQFRDFNQRYHRRFAFPFVICARLNKKDAILHGFAERLENSVGQELAAAIQETCKIAQFRLNDLVADSSSFPAPAERRAKGGRVTTRVLDTAHGCPAAGMKIQLSIIENGTPRVLKVVETNDSGRTDDPLIEGPRLKPGVYELLFFVGDYFRKTLRGGEEPAFLERVPVHFGIAEPSANFHVPLIVTPWSYSSYRGS